MFKLSKVNQQIGDQNKEKKSSKESIPDLPKIGEKSEYSKEPIFRSSIGDLLPVIINNQHHDFPFFTFLFWHI